MPKQLLVRVQYPRPKSGKVIDSGVLDQVLIDIRKVSCQGPRDLFANLASHEGFVAGVC